MSKACIIFVLQQTKKAHAHEHQGNTKKNDIMLCADNQWLCSGIPELMKHEKIKARKLSYDSLVYLLMLGQFLHGIYANGHFRTNERHKISRLFYFPVHHQTWLSIPFGDRCRLPSSLIFQEDIFELLSVSLPI